MKHPTGRRPRDRPSHHLAIERSPHELPSFGLETEGHGVALVAVGLQRSGAF